MKRSSANNDLNSVLLNSLQAHVAILNRDGIILDVNESWQSFDTPETSISRPGIGKDIFKTLKDAARHGNDYALQLLVGMNNVIDGSKRSFSQTYPLQIDDNIFWFTLTFHPYNDANTHYVMIHEESSASQELKNPGKSDRFLNLGDGNLRENKQKELVTNKQFMEAALNCNPGIFFVLDTTGTLVPWHNQYISSLGYDSETLKGKNVADFVVENQKEKVQSKIKECLRTGNLALETQLLTNNNQIRDYHIQADRFEQDGNVYIVGSGTDITQRREAERKIRGSQLMLQQLFDNAPIGLTILDSEDNIQQVNKSFEHIFDYTEQEVIGQNINDLVVPVNKEEEAKNASRITHNGESLQIKSVRQTKDNREVPVLIGGIPVKHAGDVIAIYGMYVDISEQSEYQQKIEQALHEKEILLAELHHRVKNNLALINSLLDLQLFESDDPDLKRNLGDIKNRIMTIASTHEVLYQNGSLNEIPINLYIREIIESNSLRNETQFENITIHPENGEASLNIEQSTSYGLLLNELLSLIFTFSKKDNKNDLDIRFKQSGSTVHLIIEGNELIKNPNKLKEHSSLHTTLIDVLIAQLDGQLIWPDTGNDDQKFELIFEKSESGNGPARHLLENY